MQQWQYQTIAVIVPSASSDACFILSINENKLGRDEVERSNLISYLSKAGQEGWEVVGTMNTQFEASTSRHIIILKRPPLVIKITDPK